MARKPITPAPSMRASAEAGADMLRRNLERIMRGAPATTPEPPGRVICSGCGRPGGHTRLKSCPRGSYIQKLTAEVVDLKERLMRAGLYKTGQAMESAVTAIGYEIAECIEADAKEGKQRRKP